jgi:NAD(P)H dehydrogenase (quinone)
MNMPIYAVTGALGHVGRFAVQQLLAHGVPASDIVAVVRTRGKPPGLAAIGVQVREADYSRPETLGAALAGADRLLLVSSGEVGQLAQLTNVIKAAKTALISSILYTRMLNADDSTSPWSASTGTPSGCCARRRSSRQHVIGGRLSAECVIALCD